MLVYSEELAFCWLNKVDVSSMQVTLLVPWLTPEEQKTIFPEGLTFSTPAEQEAWVTNWVEKRTGFPCNFQLNFYPARYDGQGFFSIFPVGGHCLYASIRLMQLRQASMTWVD